MKYLVLFIFIFFQVPTLAQFMGISRSNLQVGKTMNDTPRISTMNMNKFESKLKAARTLIDQGDYQEAIYHLLLAKKMKVNGKLFEYLGDAYTADRQYVQAVQAYQSAFEIYLKQKSRLSARRVFETLKYYETDLTKELNKKFEKSLRSL